MVKVEFWSNEIEKEEGEYFGRMEALGRARDWVRVYELVPYRRKTFKGFTTYICTDRQAVVHPDSHTPLT